VENTIHRVNHYPADSVVCFVDTYPLDSDLSSEWHYPAFEQMGLDQDKHFWGRDSIDGLFHNKNTDTEQLEGIA